MADRIYEIRDPIYGFVEFNEWERDIINSPVFQRLRRIRQLAWTDLTYPGAMHTRFEHSLGVMHLATKLYDKLVQKYRHFLEAELHYDKGGEELGRDRSLIRLAALLHDVGHPPFSHSAECLMPKDGKGKKYTHEHYSAALISNLMTDVIDNHPINKRRFSLTAKDIGDFLLGKSAMGKRGFWKDLVSGQLDADRMDYLLRDSHHIGVSYGKYDLDRIIATVSISETSDDEKPVKFSIEDGGFHAAEALILARYFMFTQVYFHKTRRAYDHHIAQAIKAILHADGQETFPAPDSREGIERYFQWDDWKVLGELSNSRAGVHGERMLQRNHFRVFHQTNEVPGEKELEDLEYLSDNMKAYIEFIDKAENSWYKFEKEDEIYIHNTDRAGFAVPLSDVSSVVRGLRAIKQIRLYTDSDKTIREQAENAVREKLKERSVK